MEFLTTTLTGDGGYLPVAVTAFLIAGLVKGVVGLGLPPIAMALLVLVMSPAEAAALLIVPSLVTNIWQLQPVSTLGPLVLRLRWMLVAAVAGTLAGAAVLGKPAGSWATITLGSVLIVYSGWSLAGARVEVSATRERWLGPLMGAITGVLTSATGVSSIPAAPWLQSIGLQRDALVQALGLSFVISTLALAAGLAFNDALPAARVGLSLWLLLPALAGMVVGQWLRHRLAPALFRTCFLASLGLLGVQMVVRAVLHG